MNTIKKSLKFLINNSIYVFLLLEIAILVYCNIFHTRDAMDADSAKLMTRSIEMWNNKAIFIDGWHYQTTGEFDCGALLAALFYGITGNIFISFCISNIITIVMWILVVFKLFANLKLPRKYAAIAMMLILAPYSFGMLEYTNMMFFSGGQYGYKTFIPIVLITVLTYEKCDVSYYFLCALLAILTFLTGASSGMFVLLMGIMPVTCCVIINNLINKKATKNTVVVAATVIISIVGILVEKLKHINSLGNSFKIIAADSIFSSLSKLISEFLGIIKPLCNERTEIFSANGITELFKIFIAILICVLSFGEIKKVFGLDLLNEGKADENSIVSDVKRYLISITVMGAVVQFLTTASSRYCIMGMIAMIIISVINLKEILKKNNKLIENVIIYLITVIAAFISILGLRDAMRYYFDPHTEYEEIMKVMEEENIEMVLYADGPELAECMRIIDFDREYIGVNDEKELITFDWYNSLIDEFEYGDTTAIVVSSEFPEERHEGLIPDDYDYLKSVEQYQIYVRR